MRFRFGDFQLDDRQFTLTGPDGPVHVEPQVFELLHHLLVHRDRVVLKEELLDAIWGDRFVSESALTSRVKAARQAVGDDGRAQRIIKTAHGRGYQFIAAVETDVEGDGAPDGGAGRGLPRLRNTPIGRDRDLARVRSLLCESPLVTVTGSGGIGKTTLALAVAESVQADYVDGAVFVDLSPVPHQSDITRAVAAAAGIEGGASESVDAVAGHLALRPVLVVLDNCEHVLDQVVRLVDRMLDRGGSAHVLATSREPLGLAGEHVWPLGPLHGDGPALFVERARAAEPRVPWDPDDPEVVELCRRLDDVPLAIELAAGQLRRFDLGELNRRLGDRLTPLASSASGDGSRHATMETAIDWSYQLLDADEQCLLRQLSVFPASFDVEAVESVAPRLPQLDPFTVFGQLVDKSLVVRLPGTGRYRLLETIRVFGRERLDEAGETAAGLERHRRHVCERLSASSRLDRWFSARLGATFRSGLDDARQAFRLSIERGEAADALEVALGASFLWRNALGCAEGVTWLDELLALDLPPRDELWALILRADLGQGRGDHRLMFDAAAAAQERLDEVDDAGAACLVTHYGALAHLTEPDHAQDRLDDALRLAGASGDQRLVTLIRAFLGVADLAAGRHDEVRDTVTRLERVASEDGYDWFIVHWTGWLLALAEQDAPVARGWMDRQQGYLDRTGIVETWITAFSLAVCDIVEGGDHRTGLTRALDLADREGYRADADCVLALAYAEMCADRFESAAELLGTAVHGRFNATAHYVLYRAVLDRLVRERLDDVTMTGAMERGRSRSPSAALADHGIARPV